MKRSTIIFIVIGVVVAAVGVYFLMRGSKPNPTEE